MNLKKSCNEYRCFCTTDNVSNYERTVNMLEITKEQNDRTISETILIEEKRIAVCTKCNKKWNVSIYRQIPKSGYICPSCMEKKRNKVIKTALKWICITIAGFILFDKASEAAYIERGYKAYGGEYILLLFPVWFWLIESVVNDIKHDLKAERNFKND